MGGGVVEVFWWSTRQSCTKLSKTEAKYVAANEPSREAVWLQYLLQNVELAKEDAIVIHCDNQWVTYSWSSMQEKNISKSETTTSVINWSQTKLISPMSEQRWNLQTSLRNHWPPICSNPSVINLESFQSKSRCLFSLSGSVGDIRTSKNL